MENPINYWYQKYISLKTEMDQMMEEAVEGEVKDYRYLREVNYSSAKIEFNSIPDLKVGDKVRVIVLPKEETK